MDVHQDTAEALVDEVFLFNRALKSAVQSSDTPTPLPIALTGVLAQLATDGECRQSELAAQLCVSQSSLSRQISDLVDEGYVSREPDPDDGRATRIRVTDAGTACLELTRELRVAQLSRMLGGWSEAQAVKALDSLRQLKNTFSGAAHSRHTGAKNTPHTNTEHTHLIAR